MDPPLHDAPPYRWSVFFWEIFDGVKRRFVDLDTPATGVPTRQSPGDRECPLRHSWHGRLVAICNTVRAASNPAHRRLANLGKKRRRTYHRLPHAPPLRRVSDRLDGDAGPVKHKGMNAMRVNPAVAP